MPEGTQTESAAIHEAMHKQFPVPAKGGATGVRQLRRYRNPRLRPGRGPTRCRSNLAHVILARLFSPTH
jgi:hypothetical protein